MPEAASRIIKGLNAFDPAEQVFQDVSLIALGEAVQALTKIQVLAFVLNIKLFLKLCAT